jgi:hypothetical protein
VFQSPWAVKLLRTVLHEVRWIYEFEVRELRVEDDRGSFFINAVDGVAAMLRNRGQSPQKNRSGFEKFEKNPLFQRFFLAKLKHVRW